MKNLTITMLLALLFAIAAPAGAAAFDPSHKAWTALLVRHVRWNAEGTATAVDYGTFAKDRASLDAYLASLAAVKKARFDRWDWPRRQAFLINAYNAATVQLVLGEFPGIDSIKDIGGLFSTPWKQEFVNLLGATRSLDQIEHELLRGATEYRDPRIHFAVNCASIGCPALRPEAFTGPKLDAQLEDQTRRFLRDEARNRYDAKKERFELSSIFDWYGEDFEKHGGGLRAFVIRHGIGPSVPAAGSDANIRFLAYDWRLNDMFTPVKERR